jgi:universal stress protein E
MTKGKNRYLAVIDPTRTDQWALQKAVSLAADRGDTDVVALLCAYSDVKCADPAEMRAAERRRHSIWLDELIDRFESTGVSIEPVVEWNSDWRDAVCDVARANQVDLVIKRASGRPSALGNSDRQLIRTLKSALLLVKHEPARVLRKVLVAVDFNAAAESHTALNNAIIDLGRRICGTSDTIELHAVSAYPDSDKFVHPPDIAKKLGIGRNQAHVRRGKAADIIPDYANEIDADLVIVGNVGRRGLSGIKVGNTAEKILTEIRSDVLVLVQEEHAVRKVA